MNARTFDTQCMLLGLYIRSCCQVVVVACEVKICSFYVE